MILIADSGSTKTEWRLIDTHGQISQIRSEGINPYYQDEEAIFSSVKGALAAVDFTAVKAIHFYGAGCSSEANIGKMRSVFVQLCPKAQIDIHTDLLAAARSLCGHSPGIACILGTGANSCLYDGKDILSNVVPLGYILGDEGSGAHLGKQLLARFLRKELPQTIADRLEKRFDLSKPVILEHVYRKEMPAKYLAGFSKFIFQHIKDPYMYAMVYEGFEAFFNRNIIKYPDYQQQPVHFTGSVAFYYANILRQVARDLNINVQHIVEGPVAGLALYHQKENNT